MAPLGFQVSLGERRLSVAKLRVSDVSYLNMVVSQN